MAVPFSRTHRALEADAGPGRPARALAVLLLSAWGTWFFLAPMTVYESSPSARLEVAQTARAVRVAVSGELAELHVGVGDPIEEGQLLAELDSSALRLERRQRDAQGHAAGARLEALRAALVAQRRALDATVAEAESAAGEADARAREASSAAGLAALEATRADSLRQLGQIPESERDQRLSDADQRRAAADAARLAVRRLVQERSRSEQDRRALVQELEERVAALEGELEINAAALARLDWEIEQHQVRAPISGVIAEWAPLRPRDRVNTGARLGVVLPRGEIVSVAYFESRDALGRIEAGQAARMRLDAFPWLEYGSLTATVREVAGEERYGRVRVVLSVDTRAGATRIPLRHGLPGVVEIAVARATPARLVVRAVGGLTRSGG